MKSGLIEAKVKKPIKSGEVITKKDIVMKSKKMVKKVEVVKEPEYGIKEIVNKFVSSAKDQLVKDIVTKVLTGKSIYDVVRDTGKPYQEIQDIFVTKMREVYRNVTPEVDTDGRLSISEIIKEVNK